MTVRIASDVGGTFTDSIAYDPASRRIAVSKVPTTPQGREIGTVEGLRAALGELGLTGREVAYVGHGMTTATNAVIQRTGARTAFVTNRGFRDLLLIGRQDRPSLYDIGVVRAPPLVPRELCYGITGRLDPGGREIAPLSEAELAEAAADMRDRGVEAVAIAFLHAYANPAHELRAGAIVRALWPNDYVTLGHELLSEYREYERGTTASVNAAVQPILDRYVRRLRGELERRGFSRDLLVMNGNGGTVSSRLVAHEAAKTVMSGPASGVIAAAATLAQSGFTNAITYDMGGTSTDVALIHGGVPEVSSELAIDYGLPIHVPMVDVRSVGAGGGSIASLNAAGVLKVGPESAGSTPGPICYRRGGTEPTITDANLALGRLDPAGLTAVEGTVDVDPVRGVIRDRLARPLGFSVEDAAAAVIKLANTHMAGAIRLVSLSRGYDPRDFVLFAFGGAGPLHAVAIARELGIPEVLVPARPGLTNALGCLVADLRQDLVNTVNAPLATLDMDVVKSTLEAQCAQGQAINAEEQDEIVETVVLHGADMQFRGQTHLIRVAIPSPAVAREELQALFEGAYFARFRVRLPEIRAVLVNLVTSVIGRRRGFALSTLAGTAEGPALIGHRDLYADGRWHAAAVYARDRLRPENRIEGPAVVQQVDATTVIEPGAVAVVDEIGNLRINVGTVA
jgi:N-methylhydantoinase A